MPTHDAPQSMSGCFFRAFWALLGPALTLVSLMFKWLQNDTRLGPVDAAFGILTGLCVSARWLDDPAETPSPKQYSLGCAAIAIVLWLLVHGIVMLRS